MATVALRHLNLNDALNYAFDSAVFIAGVAILPTIAAVEKREPLPPWPVLPLSLPFLRTHFTLAGPSKTVLQSDRWYTVLTHMLCHVDANHRSSNVMALLCTGWNVWSAFGRRGWLGTLLAGTVVASFDPLRGRERQLRGWLDTQSGQLVPSLTPHVARLWASCDGACVCGMSSGVCALLGVELCLAVEQTVALLRQWWGDRSRGGDWTPQRVQLLQRVAVHLLFVGQSLSYVLKEHRSLTSGGSLSVHHGGHLAGILAGAGCFALLRALGCERGPPCPWRANESRPRKK